MANTETLTCSLGHEWEREVRKGPKPKMCPEHAEEAKEERERERAANLALSRHDRWAERIYEDQETLYDGLDPESLRKLNYCDSQILSRRRDDDADFLFEIRDTVLRKTTRTKKEPQDAQD